MKQAETTYAKVAPCVMRTAGLFCKASSCAPRRPLDVAREFEGLIYRFTAPTQLTEKELEVLLALTAIGCSQDGTFYTTRQFSGPDATTRARKKLAANVEIRTSYSTLARELGRSAGGDAWPPLSRLELFTFERPVTQHPRDYCADRSMEHDPNILIHHMKKCKTLNSDLGGDI